ncbi:hypothetical protein [Bacillus suaedaesalsae]|uniref:DUF4367 domain-containing protein n=1 Tax=Bacillus suaedaesalsae TaxID=2810349 RepID=A0ABS2DHP6_9BACI|nr:hypothetical protein [Bacillus suaedaesalsae]MBM6617973.1 hypothetical protein [Bacillus suaedaesalsae]
MKKRVLMLVVMSIILLFGFSYIPQKVFNISPTNVSKIIVFNGTNGEEIVIVDRVHIETITKNLNDVTFQKGKPSIGYLGYTFRMTIYDQKDNEMEKFIINSNDMLRYKGFFYMASDDEIEYEYINNLFEKGLE